VIGTIEERKGILPSTFNINMYNTIIGPQPTASSYRLYNTQAKNAYRNAFREVVKKKMRLERQNQGSASIFPRQELTRHGDRRHYFFSSWRKRWRRCGALPSLRNTGLGATVAWCGGFCDDVCGPLVFYRCYRMFSKLPVGPCGCVGLIYQV
jgi:hypothetical protein